MSKKKPAKKDAIRKLPERIESIEAKHVFSEPEKAQLLDELSRSQLESDSLKDMKKNSMSDWSTRIKTAESKVRQLSAKAQAGYEMRPCEARVEFDAPNRKKTYFHRETGEKIETRDMTEADFELDLFRDVVPFETNVGETVEEAMTE